MAKWRDVAAACSVTAAGASMDAYVYLDHGHVFANAQTGNIVLFATHLAAGESMQAARHVPPFVAFCAGVLASRLVAPHLKRVTRASRPIRLAVESVVLIMLAFTAQMLSDNAVTACVALLAGFQISSYSHLGGVSFNTGMTTGNLWNALTALGKILSGEEGGSKGRLKSEVLGLLVMSFVLGALLGGFATLDIRDNALLCTASLVATAAALLCGSPDPV
jgi:uncharacterized membrane protein YoaK (UPF0700 family)